MPKKNHTWTAEDDQGLLVAIEQCTPMLEHYREHSTVDAWWSAVAGVLAQVAPGLVVTGAAARRRRLTLQQVQAAEAPETLVKADPRAVVTPEGAVAWEQLEAKIEDWERDLQEVTYERMERVERKIDALLTAWGLPIEGAHE